MICDLYLASLLRIYELEVWVTSLVISDYWDQWIAGVSSLLAVNQ